MQHTAVPASFQLPQLSDLLRGVLDNVAASSNPHFIQLITTVDRDIRANQKVIHELHHANECLLIKFSEDVKELFANAPTPTITNVQHQTGQQTRPESSTHNLQEPTLQRNDGGTPRSTQTMRLSSLSHTTDFITCSHIYCLFAYYRYCSTTTHTRTTLICIYSNCSTNIFRFG
jgi:hypothetical protein